MAIKNKKLDYELTGFQGRRRIDENPGTAVILMLAVIAGMVHSLLKEDLTPGKAGHIPNLAVTQPKR